MFCALRFANGDRYMVEHDEDRGGALITIPASDIRAFGPMAWMGVQYRERQLLEQAQREHAYTLLARFIERLPDGSMQFRYYFGRDYWFVPHDPRPSR